MDHGRVVRKYLGVNRWEEEEWKTWTEMVGRCWKG